MKTAFFLKKKKNKLWKKYVLLPIEGQQTTTETNVHPLYLSHHFIYEVTLILTK